MSIYPSASESVCTAISFPKAEVTRTFRKSMYRRLYGKWNFTEAGRRTASKRIRSFWAEARQA